MTHYMALIPGKHVARAKHATASVPAEEAKKGRNGVMTERTEGGGHVPRTSVIFFLRRRFLYSTRLFERAPGGRTQALSRPN